jgi:AcrR family transcriptional regulator
MATRPPVKDHKDKERTRRDLVAAAMEVFAERGFIEPSILEICSRAGYSRGAFYANFEDRDDLLGAVMEQMISSFVLDNVEGQTMGDIPTMVGNFLMAVMEKRAWALDARPKWRFHHSLEACARSEKVRRKYLDAIDKVRARLKAQIIIGQRDGRVRRDIDAGTLTAVFIGMAYGGVVMIELGATYDFGPVALDMLKLLKGTGPAEPASQGKPSPKTPGGNDDPTE